MKTQGITRKDWLWTGIILIVFLVLGLMHQAVNADDPRTWTSNDGKHTRQATYVASDATTVCLEYSNGEQKKVPLSALKGIDRRYVADRVAEIAASQPQRYRMTKELRTKILRAKKSARARAKRLNSRASFNANIAGAMAGAHAKANAGHSAVLRSKGAGSIRRTRVYRTHIGDNSAVTTVGDEFLPYAR